jgi:glycosyltransferase involved in cell wall biosynthesis
MLHQLSKHVAIISNYGFLGISPSLLNVAELLAKAGYKVDVFGYESEMFPPPRFNASSIALHLFQADKVVRHIPTIIQAQVWRVKFLLGLWKYTRSHKYDFFFAVDQEGLFAATLLKPFLNAPLIYYSLELSLPSELTSWGLRNQLLKVIEAWCNRWARFTIIQDERRAEWLVQHHGIDSKKILIIPNSPLGLPPDVKRDFWRRKFNLSEGKKVFLQAGGMGYSRFSIELVKAAQEWPDNWVLILHGYELTPGYLAELNRFIISDRVFLSTDLVPYEQLDELYSSADIGLSLYRNVDENYYHMASGKVAHYLRCGVPVITADFPNLINTVSDTASGFCVSGPAQVSEAALKIFAHYQVFSEAAKKVYLERLDYGIYFEKALGKIAPRDQ